MASMKLSEWVAAERGRCKRLAEHLQVPQSFVSKMVSGEKPVPIAHMAAIEGFTQGAVIRRDLRPDDWHLIWPELATEPATAREGANV